MKKPVIQVSPTKVAISTAGRVIIDILHADCDEATKASALEALTKISSVTNVSIVGNNFTTGD